MNDERLISWYEDIYSANPDYCENKFILRWWKSDFDNSILESIRKNQWAWAELLDINYLVSTVEPIEINLWKNNDPICKEFAWYNVLYYFVKSRAYKLGYLKLIREPKIKQCAWCKQYFIESSIRPPIVKRQTINQIDFCQICSDKFMYGDAHRELTKKENPKYLAKDKAYFYEEVKTYLTNLTNIIKRVPTKNFGKSGFDFWGLSKEDRVAVFGLLENRLSPKNVEYLFGSWLAALIETGILEDGAKQTARGTQCLAVDGHVCLSIGEKTIDDFLYYNGIVHEKEPSYPEGYFRADFKIDNVFVKYFGLAGNKEYDDKTKHKIGLCQKHNIPLISLYSKDIINIKAMEKIFAKWIPDKNIRE